MRGALGPDGPRLMAKIETRAAVAHLDELLEVADGVMVARGDLGIDLPIEDVPHLQKRIIRACGARGSPCSPPRRCSSRWCPPRRPPGRRRPTWPTRWATAPARSCSRPRRPSGTIRPSRWPRWPVSRPGPSSSTICTPTPTSGASPAAGHRRPRPSRSPWRTPRCGPPTSWAWPPSCAARAGPTARAMAALRPGCRLIGASPSVATARQLTLSWGVEPLEVDEYLTTDEMVWCVVEAAVTQGLVQHGDTIAVLAGAPDATPHHRRAPGRERRVGRKVMSVRQLDDARRHLGAGDRRGAPGGARPRLHGPLGRDAAGPAGAAVLVPGAALRPAGLRPLAAGRPADELRPAGRRPGGLLAAGPRCWPATASVGWSAWRSPSAARTWCGPWWPTRRPRCGRRGGPGRPRATRRWRCPTPRARPRGSCAA